VVRGAGGVKVLVIGVSELFCGAFIQEPLVCGVKVQCPGKEAA
jgi:hypothetical protein